jgi:hypothetical protein
MQKLLSAAGIYISFDSDGFTSGSSMQILMKSSNLRIMELVSCKWQLHQTQMEVSQVTVSANTTSGFSIVSYTGTGSYSIQLVMD